MNDVSVLISFNQKPSDANAGKYLTYIQQSFQPYDFQHFQILHRSRDWSSPFKFLIPPFIHSLC